MYDLAHTWPWSAPQDDFFAIFFVLSAIFMLTGVLVAIVAGSALDGPVQTTTALSSSLSTSSAGVGARQTLRLGQWPKGDEVFVAALLGGLPKLEAALAAAGTAAGWLRVGPHLEVEVLADVTPDEPLLARCKEILDDPAAGRTPRHRLRTAAVRLRPMLQARAEELGLARQVDRRSALILLGTAGVAVAAIVGGLRLAVDVSFDLGMAYVIYWILAAQAAVAVTLSIWLTARHRQARAWLAWLDDSITALRADVRAGREMSMTDIVTVAAVDGFTLGSTGIRLGLAAFRR